MAEHVIIDGNNLLYAMYEHAPLPNIGRETLVRIIERWAAGRTIDITLVFDGGEPRGSMAEQMRSDRIDVRFGAPASADDVIVAMVQETKDPGKIRVVSGDKAIGSEARRHRCRHTTSVAFVAELFPPQGRPSGPVADTSGAMKPEITESVEDWLKTFGFDGAEAEPFDGNDAMRD